ncbi:MAG: peptide chain release factor aRF-1 [Candidatus Bathyarchaeota archaeon]|nr:peptide chain release factor aRF-1 [Candidatus Bathyarchaeota archaeon]
MEVNTSLSQETAFEQASVRRFKMKKLLEELASKEGRHTELVSLYIPPGRQVSDVLNVLRQEYETASNIKSKTTRHNVQDAIERAIQRLKLFNQVPSTGLVIFSGAISQGPPGSEKVETYVIVPPEPLDVYLYRCDSRFHVEPLLELLKEKETYGILVMDGSEATFATITGRRLDVVKSITSGISGKHRAGGQSARRFERLREVEVNEYYKRVAKYANQIFLEVPNLKGIIVAGPGPTKNDFLEKDYLHYTLKSKILAVVDTSYTDEYGVREVVSKTPEILKNVRYVEEKRLVQQFLYEVGKDIGSATYGVDEVKKAVEDGLVKTLLISEELDLINVKVACSTCNYVEKKVMRFSELQSFKLNLPKNSCPSCGSLTLQVVEEKSLLDVFIEMAEKAGVEVEFISSSHEEGEMLLKSFGGVAALLKYKKG